MLGSKPPEVNWHGAVTAAACRNSCLFCLIRAQCGRLNLPCRPSHCHVNPYLTLGAAALLALLIALVAATLLLRRRQALRGSSLSALLDLADRLELDLKTCRSGLQQAQAVMPLNQIGRAAGR